MMEAMDLLLVHAELLQMGWVGDAYHASLTCLARGNGDVTWRGTRREKQDQAWGEGSCESRHNVVV